MTTPGRLREFFAPRSIAVVGASDTSGWARLLVASSAAAGFTGPLIPVHPLGVAGDDAIRAAFAQVLAAGERVPGARVDGVLVTAMRATGVELLAGVTVDPVFGPVLAVGLGGVWVEVLADTALRVLPAGPGEVRQMLGELRGAALLRGARGAPSADLGALAEVICGIADAAASLGGSLRTLEVNPLWVNGAQIEALDVLVVTEPPGRSRKEPAA